MQCAARSITKTHLPHPKKAQTLALQELGWDSLNQGIYISDSQPLSLQEDLQLYIQKLEAGQKIKLVVQLVDSRHGLTDDDRNMVEFLNETEIPYVIVATKTDKLNKTEREKAVKTLVSEPSLAPGTKIILFSSESKEGKNDVWDAILEYAEK